MKNKRQEKILEIISSNNVETQEDLIRQLKEEGFNCAQSTISRDIKQLHLIKEPVPDTKNYRYTVSGRSREIDSVDRMRSILRECCLSCDFAHNLILVKTMPGLASAAGAALDAMELNDMLGCVCGHDTVLVVMRDETPALELCRRINMICK